MRERMEWERDRAARTEAAIAHVNEIVRTHAKALARQYLTKTKVDAYGANDLSAWFKEEDHFVTRVLSPGLSDEELGLLNRPAD
ncbi:hypothetical protein ABTD35_19990, partial [Acinetobacter baumannii]